MEHGTALLVEPFLSFVDQRALTLRVLVKNLPISNRPDARFGAGEIPLFSVPKFANFTREREAKMTERTVRDSALHWRIRNVWAGFNAFTSPRITVSAYREEIRNSMAGDYRERIPEEIWRPTERDSFYLQINDLVRAFEKRGGQLIFIRPPTLEGYRAFDNHYYQREKYWDRLLLETHCPGVHFEDYASLQGFDLPEWSHIRADQTPAFTKALAGLVYEKLKQ